MKKILIFAFLIVLIFGAVYYVVEAKSNSKKIFGINDKDYKIIEKRNTLKLFKYEGRFYEKLNIKEEQSDEFITKATGGRDADMRRKGIRNDIQQH